MYVASSSDYGMSFLLVDLDDIVALFSMYFAS
jgi:hypothetical protein